ncbi:NosD domain-containing protein [Methanogenium organophilum]|uniref:Ig-like domain-containing protein n=1 Tax=Methanogenium organophilum TaxID=2199 RepID=A0A9X9T7B0_METOG|nr:NosD domain-containing protein [Methanogenium organophilum]WAI00520.1 Ig-like domain-containing protein [Methanogenium organophilum]
MKHGNESGKGSRKLALVLFSLALVLMLSSSAGAQPLPAASHIWVNMANDDGAKFEDNGSYYIKFDGGGLNALHLSPDPANLRFGEVTVTEEQSGTFYVTDTGGRGYSDDTVLMLAVNGTLPSDFRVHIHASGYNWTPVAVVNTLPAVSDLEYIDGSLDEWFTAEDFVYSPQTWKPAGNNLPLAYPLFYEQDTTDTTNNFSLMFIDLNAGPISKANGLADLSTLENSGGVKVEYTFENLETFASVNAYAWCNQSNQGRGISWTNRVSGSGSSVYEVIGIPPVLTSISVSPETAEVTEGEGQQFTATALDQDDHTMDGVVFTWTSSDETVGTVNETGYFTALSAGTTTLTAANETVEGEATVTVIAEPSGPQPLPDYNYVFFKVANDAGVKYNAFGNNTYNVRFEGYDRGLNALHISTDPSVNFGQVTVTENQSGTFYATDSGGKGYEDEILLMVAVNGTIPDDFILRVQADGYTWTPNPVSNRAPSLDNVTYQSVSLNETFTKEDFRYGPQIWKPTGNGFDYPIYYGQNMTDTENTFQLMFIDLNAGVLRPNGALENNGAVRINYTLENLESFAAFGVYGYCQNSNNGDDMVAWANAVIEPKIVSGYSVIGSGSGPVPDRIEVEPTTAQVVVGDVYHFAATAFDALNNVISGLTFSWASTNENVGTIDESGNFTALAPGTTNVTASGLGIIGTSAVTVVSAESTTWYVDGDGSADFVTIQAAVDGANAGDTIIVRDGTYVENVDVTKSLVIKSENGSAVTTLYSAARDSGFDVIAGDVTIDGFTITAVNGRGNYGIYVHGADNALIVNNTVANCRECLKLESSSGNTVSRNTLSVSNNIANNVFWLADASNNVIYLNSFEKGAVTVAGTSTGNIFQSPTEMQYAFNGADYQSYTGNYWNGYTGSDVDGNGIGDDAYAISASVIDEYPLIQKLDGYSIYGPAPEGTTYYVSADGSADFTTIQAAIDASANGDTIIVRDGTYVESVNVTKKVSVISENGAATTILAPGYFSGFVVTADGARVEGFTIERVNGNGNFGVLITRAKGVSIINNTFNVCREGIKLDTADRAVITGNDVLINNKATNNVLWLINSSNNQIYFNTFTKGTVTVEGTSSENIWSTPVSTDYIYSGTAWTSYLGNTWPGYAGTDADGNGIGDTPYAIGTEADNYPLVSSIGDYTFGDDVQVITTVTISPESAILSAGTTQAFTATAYDQYGVSINDTTFAWSVENVTVGTIDADGTFTCLSAGNTTVTAEAGGVSSSASITALPPAQTWYVDASGAGDFVTITDAVLNASAGDIIIVRDGEYREYVTINKMMTIRSENGPETTQIISDGPTAVTITAPEVTFDGFTVTGALDKFKYGIGVLSGGDGATLCNNNCSLNTAGICFKSVSGIVAENNTCSENYRGIFVYSDCDGVILINNRFTDNDDAGLSLAGSNVIVSDNLFESNGVFGLYRQIGNNALISNNTFSNNGFAENGRGWAMTFSRNTEDVIFGNNFVGNKALVGSAGNNQWYSGEDVDYVYDGKTYTGKIGNYWGGSFPTPDSDGNGIGDLPAVITGMIEDNYPLLLPSETYFGKESSLPVPSSVTLLPQNRTMKMGYPLQYVGKVFDQNGAEMEYGVRFFWSVSDTGVATIDDSGVVTGVSAGETEVTVRCASLTETTGLTVENGESGPKTIVVDQDGNGDVIEIGAALNAAVNGDTILVRNGTYLEELVINTSVTLRSEYGSENTAIFSPNENYPVLRITVPNVTIDGFAVDWGFGANWGESVIEGSSNTLTVTNCSIDISDNEHEYGMVLNGADNRVIGNVVTGGDKGIWLVNVSDSVVSGNTVKDSVINSIYLSSSSGNNLITGNLLESAAILLIGKGSSGNIVTENIARSPDLCQYWVKISSAEGNAFYENNLYNFTTLASTGANLNAWNATEPVSYTYRGETFTGLPGNFLDSYTGVDLNGDGLGDTPVNLSSGNYDYHPLMGAWSDGVISDGTVVSLIELTPGEAELKVGCRQKFLATALGENGLAITGVDFVWTCENETVGTIDGAGMFTALSDGEAMITVSAGTVQSTANVSVSVAHGEQNQKSDIAVPACNVTDGPDGKKQISLNCTGSDVTVGGNEIVISEETFNMTIVTVGSPEVNGSVVNGTVAGIRLNTVPVVTDLGEGGRVSAAIEANLTGIPSGAGLDVTVSDNISAGTMSAFQIAATNDGLDLDAVAYTMNIVKTNLTNGQDIADATIRMAVSPAWVAANGGYDGVKIIRFAEDGTREVLDTVYLGFDGELDQFEAYSPNGLSVFGLSATSTATSPTGSSSSGGTSSSIANARCDGINAGETGVFVMDKTAITEIDVKAGINIPKMMLTAEQVSKPSAIDAAPNEVYQYVDVTSYFAPEDSMEMATLKFSVDKEWLDSIGAAASDVKMYHYDEASDSWQLLSTVSCGVDGSCYTFFADTPSFSLFAISAEKGIVSAVPDASEDGTQPAPESGNTPAAGEQTPADAQGQADAQTPATTTGGDTTLIVIIVVVVILAICGGVYWKKTNGKK